jgi:hypothetical protein
MLSRLEVVAELRRVIARLESTGSPASPVRPPVDFERTPAGNYVVRSRAPVPSLRAGGLTAALGGKTASLERVCVLDTETTGLAGGTGTLAFLVGLARVGPEGVAIEQHVCASPAKEGALLDDVLRTVGDSTLLVTFNGKSFDLPLLRTRLVLSRRSPASLDAVPHLDVLGAARRLWTHPESDCRLVTLEARILGRPRQDDTPGSEAPAAYAAYLKSGDPRQLAAMVRHNREDLLGTLALAARALHVLDSPFVEAESLRELSGAARLWSATRPRSRRASRG